MASKKSNRKALPSVATGGGSRRLKFGHFQFYTQHDHVCYSVVCGPNFEGKTGNGADYMVKAVLGDVPAICEIKTASVDICDGRMAATITKTAGRAWGKLIRAKILEPRFIWPAEFLWAPEHKREAAEQARGIKWRSLPGREALRAASQEKVVR